jgi:diguanylate cyclase (GGDEF)-like protein/PAS domain S-box-containing protein
MWSHPMSISLDVLREVPLGVYCLNRDRVITFWNPAAERLAGYPASEVLGRPCADDILRHCSADGRELCENGCPVAQTLRDGLVREACVFLHHKSGHRCEVRVKIIPILGADGRPEAAVHIFGHTDSIIVAQYRIEELEAQALTDGLTGLPNRRCLGDVLARAAAQRDRTGQLFGVILADVDHFKLINDHYGHLVGDQVLRMVGATLANVCRASDLVGRWGGEEFLGVCMAGQPGELAALAERMRVTTELAFLSIPEHRLTCTISLGVAVARLGESVEELLRRADQLLYASKNAGRNRATAA